VIDKFDCPKQPPGIMLLPRVIPVTRLVDGQAVARLGDLGVCLGDQEDMIIEGSRTMLVCGLPVARQGDAMLHGGTISTGSPNEYDGGPSWRLPSQIKLGGSGEFQNKVIRDLYALSQTPNGAAALNAIAANGQPVVIVSGQYNMTTPDDKDSIRKGGKSGSTIDFNPDRLEDNAVCKEGCVPIPPQLALGHELIHAARFGRGGATMSTVTEEKQVVGPPYGVKDKDPNWPTENGLRNDLKLGTRLNYDKCNNTQLAKNLRPGACT
jgi:hypothetical protein